MKIPPLEPKARLLGVDRAAEALARLVVEGILPGPELLKIPGLRQRLKPVGDRQNIRHLALALGVILRHRGAVEWADDFYTLNTAAHRTGFEAFSVGYSNLQVLAALGVLRCPGAPPALREVARHFLRRDLTLSCLAATPDGVVALPCGRMYASPEGGLGGAHKGIGDTAHDYRVRDVLGIEQPKPRAGGVSTQQWRRHPWLSCWPWKAIEGLSGELFKTGERDALRAWVFERKLPPRALTDPLRIPEGLTILRGQGGHAAWCERLESYGGGNNRCLPLVVARGEDVRAVVVPPPATVKRDGWAWTVTTRGQAIREELAPFSGAVELALS